MANSVSPVTVRLAAQFESCWRSESVSARRAKPARPRAEVEALGIRGQTNFAQFRSSAKGATNSSKKLASTSQRGPQQSRFSRRQAKLKCLQRNSRGRYTRGRNGRIVELTRSLGTRPAASSPWPTIRPAVVSTSLREFRGVSWPEHVYIRFGHSPLRDHPAGEHGTPIRKVRLKTRAKLKSIPVEERTLEDRI